MNIKKDELFARYPTRTDCNMGAAVNMDIAWSADEIAKNLDEELSKATGKVIVLDDDPTGVQTVHNIFVYTDWLPESIRAGVRDKERRLFYILTNSRAFSAEETKAVHTQIAKNTLDETRDFLFISRSDSTLRGHFPIETQTLRNELEHSGIKVHGEIICPFFPEGGRFTADDTHYVQYGDELVPAGETEFARDKTFGYKSSDLKEWIEEKTGGAYKSKNVVSVSIEELRALDYDGIRQKLDSLDGFRKVIVNALTYDDIKVFVTALLRSMHRGKRFILRSAAAIVKVLGAVPDKTLLEQKELRDPQNRNGGLIVVGSHVQKTSDQLEALKSLAGVELIEMNQHLAMDEAAFESEAERVRKLAEEVVSSERTAAVYTRRERFDLGGFDKEAELKLATSISEKVTSIVRELNTRPAFLIAKGGITSSDIGVKGLGVKKALVMGQILPGVPVWLTGAESKFPNMPYVVFPGNVGDENALKDAVCKFG